MQLYNPTLLTKGIRGTFIQAFTAAKRLGLREALCTTVPSTSNNEQYAWMGPPPQMDELDGSDEIDFEAMTDTSYTVTNLKFAKGIAVSRDQISDDQLGAVRLRVAQLAQVAANHPDSLITTALINGTSATLGLGYDAVSYFNNSHPARNAEGGTQDNLLAGTGITAATIADDLNTGISTLAGFLDEAGEPFHGMMTDFTIVAPPLLRRGMLEALNSTLISNTSNVQPQGLSFNLILNPRLAATDANDWYLFHTGGAVKPLVFQDREPLEFTAMEADSEAGFVREQYRYKVRARYNVGYMFWQDGVKFVNA